jgi:hypothetical protein
MELFEGDPALTLAYCDLRIFGNTIAAGSTYMQSEETQGDLLGTSPAATGSTILV